MQDIYFSKEDNAAVPRAHVHEELWYDIQRYCSYGLENLAA
ncbi:hypothetical protein [Clostridium sp. C2-6-12]|nr:hypothetical protein [Clostridium sp. C2-6-12]